LKGRQDEEKDVSDYWMILRKRGHYVTLKRKQENALCGKLALEEAVDLS
jgi:hypothetical protein